MASKTAQKQFENSFKLTVLFLLCSGIKISKNRWNKLTEHLVNYHLFYYDCFILHSVIFGEVYGVIDCIQTGKSFVELSLNLPCITISILSTVKISALYMNRGILVDLIYKLKDIHCENDNEEFEEEVGERRKAIMDSVTFLKAVILLMTWISIIVQVMFCLVPGIIMAYDYNKTGELVVMYPFLVKYHFFEVYKSSWWPLIYFHQVLATAVTCVNIFGCDTLLFALCFYVDMHFRLLGLRFENIVASTKKATKENLAKAVRRHQELIELVNQMEFLYSKSTLFHIVTASLLICLSAFIITITDEINVKLAYFTFWTMSLSQISLICYFGDMLMRSSTEISETVYKCQWYKADGDAKKIILLIMIRSQKACKLTAWNFMDLNLGAFTRILSTSWSYFALLKTMYK
ncbi:odorant receptor 67c-like [Anticarsia gemmatalis]|uniref:odorant receptor 67c-like n=1 Tax=Anticarsia gemmatalis TaxID=129554 RepID=UPI003F76BC72